MEQSANCIKETSSSGFYPEEPPAVFFGKRQGVPVCPSEAPGSTLSICPGLKQGETTMRGLGWCLSWSRHWPRPQIIYPSPIPTPLSQVGPGSSSSEFEKVTTKLYKRQWQGWKCNERDGNHKPTAEASQKMKVNIQEEIKRHSPKGRVGSSEQPGGFL